MSDEHNNQFTNDDYARLGAAIAARMESLGHTIESLTTRTRALDASGKGGLSTRTVSHIRSGNPKDYSGRTRSLIERALEWELGACTDLLKGGSPAESSDERNDQFTNDDEHNDQFTNDDYARLGAAVAARMESLGYTIGSLASRTKALDASGKGGLSTRTVSHIRIGTPKDYSGRTRSLIERALEWELGACTDVLEGGSPAVSNDRTESKVENLIDRVHTLEQRLDRLFLAVSEALG